MFARVSQSAYVCLRCQRRSLPKNAPWQPCSEPARGLWLRRRYASAAAAAATKVEEDYGNSEADDVSHEAGALSEDPESTSSRFEAAEQTPRSATPATQASPNDAEPHRRKQRTAYRKWRPSTRLGVDVLGKPAEVLILRDRERVIPTVPEEDDRERRPSLQASLDAENEPVTPEKLKEALVQIRSELGKERGQLELDEWTTLRKKLAKGFSRQQLLRFLTSHANSVAGLDHTKLQSISKAAVVRKLVEDVWAYVLPAGVEQSSAGRETQKARRGPNRQVTFKITDDAKLDHLVSTQSELLLRLAEKNGATVKVYRKDKMIKVTGPIVNCHHTISQLKHYLGQLETGVVPFAGRMSVFKDPEVAKMIPSFVKTLHQKHPSVTLTKKPDVDQFDIVSLKQQNAARALERELRLAGADLPELQKCEVWPPQYKSQSVLAPFPTLPELPWALKQLRWGRYLASSTQPSQKPGDSASILQMLTPWLGLPNLPDPQPARSGLRSEVSVTFGQALFRQTITTGRDTRPVTSSETSQSADSPNSPGSRSLESSESEKDVPLNLPVFVSESPFVTQVVTSLKPWNSRHMKQDLDEKTGTVLRAELVPTSSKAQLGKLKLPRFEIFLIAEASQNPQMGLHPVRVTAIYEQKALHLLCPTQETDIKFCQKIMRDVWYPGVDQAKPGDFASVRESLGAYLRTSSFSQDSGWSFAPFVHLPVNSALLNGQELPQPVRKVKAKRLETPTSEETVDPTAEKQSLHSAAMDESGVLRFQYMLKDVETLDVDSRAVPIDSKFGPAPESGWCLDHIVARSGETSRLQLRLADRSILSEPNLQEVDLRLMAQTALSVVDKLGNGQAIALGQEG